MSEDFSGEEETDCSVQPSRVELGQRVDGNLRKVLPGSKDRGACSPSVGLDIDLAGTLQKGTAALDKSPPSSTRFWDFVTNLAQLCLRKYKKKPP